MTTAITKPIGAMLDEIAQRFPDNDALVYPERGLRYSYQKFNDVCRQVAKGLLRLGIKKGIMSQSGRTTYRKGSSCSLQPRRLVRYW